MPQNLWYEYKVHKRQKSLKLRDSYEKLKSQKRFGIYLRPNAHGNFSACQE